MARNEIPGEERTGRVRNGYVGFNRERGGGMEWFWYGLRDGSNVPSYGSDAAVPNLSDYCAP